MRRLQVDEYDGRKGDWVYKRIRAFNDDRRSSVGSAVLRQELVPNRNGKQFIIREEIDIWQLAARATPRSWKAKPKR